MHLGAYESVVLRCPFLRKLSPTTRIAIENYNGQETTGTFVSRVHCWRRTRPRYSSCSRPALRSCVEPSTGQQDCPFCFSNSAGLPADPQLAACCGDIRTIISGGVGPAPPRLGKLRIPSPPRELKSPSRVAGTEGRINACASSFQTWRREQLGSHGPVPTVTHSSFPVAELRAGRAGGGRGHNLPNALLWQGFSWRSGHVL